MQKEDHPKKAFEEKMKKENKTEKIGNQKEAQNQTLRKETTESLKEELDKAIKAQIKDSKDLKIDELPNDLKRLQADFQNHCKGAEQEKKNFIEYASSGVLCKILLIVDELDIALKNMKSAEDKKGIQMIFDKIRKMLFEEGVTEMKCIGQKFDPYQHEAILYENRKEDGIILDEIQKGYQMKGKILRYPKVKISKNESDLNEEKPQTNKTNEENMEGE